MIWITSIQVLFVIGLVNSVEVHFETPDSGFFLKQSVRQSQGNAAVAAGINLDLYNSGKSKIELESILSIDRFTIVQNTQPVSIRASYGPFSTKQTVPARFIVPDVIETQADTGGGGVTGISYGGSINNDHQFNNTNSLLEIQQQPNVHLDISAHLVRSTIPRDAPVVRVLFHTGADPGGRMQRQKICVLLHVSMERRQALKGRCIPEGEDGVCVAEVIIPSNWWPPLPPPDRDGRIVPHKVPQRMVQVSYSVFEPPIRNAELCEPKIQIQPMTQFAKIPLVPAMTAYKELRADDTLTILIPHQPLYPMSRIHAHVFLQPQAGQNVPVFIVRARVKAGMRILGATASSDQWNISLEKENPKHTVARVTAIRKEKDPDSQSKADEPSDPSQVVEVFTWLLEVANDTKEHWDGGRIVWSVSFVHDGPKMKDASSSSSSSSESGLMHGGGNSASGHEETRKKLVAKLEIQKDDIQAVLPIAKNWELLNLAVLTGRQVSQAMKVYIVSQAGKVADVTLQSSCHAEDESVIKVSTSCSSVYVDGSEARGSANASIIVKYGTYSGRAKFIVWMPEFPLEVFLEDFRLSQIKGWKIPDNSLHHGNNGKPNRKKRAYGWNRNVDDFSNGISSERSTCRIRYQQTKVDVYARFLAVDQDSGRVSYLISRRTGLRVTDLIQPLLRVADPKIASLRGTILQGRAMGRTDVQVLSPITGRVIGAREVRVGSDRVGVKGLIVRVVSGLQLNIVPDSAIENGYVAETSVTRKLTAQYQEGLLDIDVEFSDGSRAPLRDVSVDDYFLLVESLDTEVVAFAPMLASHHPRVIAVGEGNGDLLRVTLLLSEECRMRRNVPLLKQGLKATPPPLASALASVQVDFSTLEPVGRPDTVQNDGISGRERKRDQSDLADILIGIPLKDDTNSHHEPTVQARQHRGGLVTHYPRNNVYNYKQSDMTSLEIGMYVLLTTFCFAIVVFVVSCVVYASKFRAGGFNEFDIKNDNVDGALSSNLKIMREPRKVRESSTNAHDWVWLGRSTMDRSSMVAAAGAGAGDNNGNGGNGLDNQRVRITNNPMTLNYADPDDALVEAISFDNPNHIKLPSSSSHIDTSTYNKKDRPTISGPIPLLPPPPPPSTGLASIPQQQQQQQQLQRDIDNGNGNGNGNINGAIPKLEYRPPVPPHRNIGSLANATKVAENVPPPVRRHHKHSHSNNNHYQQQQQQQQQQQHRLSNSNQIQQQQQQPSQQKRLPKGAILDNQQSQNMDQQSQLNLNNIIQHNINLPPKPLTPSILLQHNGHNNHHSSHHHHHQQHNHHNNHNQQQQQQQKDAGFYNLIPKPQRSGDNINIINGSAVNKTINDIDIDDNTAVALNCNGDNTGDELHMAEKLVECAAKQQKNAFQFDTITPKKIKRNSYEINVNNHQNDDGKNLNANTKHWLRNEEEVAGSGGGGGDVGTAASGGATTTKSLDSNSVEDNGGFITPSESDNNKSSKRVKRATVVGNPMFLTKDSTELINNVDDDEQIMMGPTESLGLDDLNMDYEQIMHYFDNLKESNA